MRRITCVSRDLGAEAAAGTSPGLGFDPPTDWSSKSELTRGSKDANAN